MQPRALKRLRTSPMGELFLDDCRASSGQLLGNPESGMAICNHSPWEPSCILARSAGTTRRQLERCLSYARDRKPFGQPIGSSDFVCVIARYVDSNGARQP